MKCSSVFIAGALAITGLTEGSARADDAKDLADTVAAASKGGDSSASTESLIKTILGNYSAYVKQLNDLANGVETPAAKPAGQNASAQTDPAKAPAANQQAGPLKTGTLQAGHVQPAGPLREDHLAGYPALSDAPPVTSVPHPTDAELAKKAQTDKEQKKLQQFYLEHPGHSPN